MRKSDKAIMLNVIISILTIVFSLLLLIDVLLSTKTAHYNSLWYGIILMYFASIFIALAMVLKAPAYINFSAIFGGIFISIHVASRFENLSFANMWPIIFICLGIGMCITFIFSRRSLYLSLGILLIAINIAMLVCAYFNKWYYIFPLIGVLFGIVALGVNVKRMYKRSSKKEMFDYYVEPSTDNEKKDNK
ncbi:MAG: hypothetical protein RR454_01530 [Clostridia bacterium]